MLERLIARTSSVQIVAMRRVRRGKRRSNVNSLLLEGSEFRVGF